MVRNSNRDSEFSSEKFTDSLQTESRHFHPGSGYRDRWHGTRQAIPVQFPLPSGQELRGEPCGVWNTQVRADREFLTC